MENMDKFNKLVGTIFGRLYEEFPVPVQLVPENFLNHVIDVDDENGAFSFSEYFESTVKWLETADYVWIAQDQSTLAGPAYDLVRSERGLEALRNVPSSLEGNASIGERLSNFSKSKASEAVSTLISLAITTLQLAHEQRGIS
ncbi:hypothetical protein ACQUQP_14340 [Marinobacterium sp. YM272]|uniref:hypothetical protein n=1 Tax=Marinobacterium sp. YM272 TaxID=3421654 RepID=UPI003D7FDBE2